MEAPVRASSWLTPTERPRHARRRPLFAPAVCAAAATLLAATYLVTTTTPSRPDPTTAVQPLPTPSVTVTRGRAVEPNLAPAVRAGLALTEWPDSVDTDLTGAGAPEWLTDRCLDIGERNLAKCAYGPAGAARTVAVLGDSVGISWLPALRAAAGLRGWRIQVLTRRQCPNAAIPGGTTRAVSKSCAGHQQWALEQVQRLRPALLFLSSGYDGAGPTEWRQGTATALSALTPLADRTVVLAPPPETGNLQKCRTRRSAPPQCTRSVSDEWTAIARAERAAAEAHGATWVDTRRWFCVQDRCPAVVSGLPVHFDGKHLSKAYATFLGPQLTAVLQD